MPDKKKEPAAAGTATSSKKIIPIDKYTTSDVVCQALDKLNREFSSKPKDRKAAAVFGAIYDALGTFCEQNAEFAQAVAQSDKTLTDCAEYTVKGCGNSISDIEVYKRAVQFYFEGAAVHVSMTLDLGDGGFSNAAPTEKPKSKAVELSLDSLLDF